jgi:SAM-dependent methyltransferase
MFSRTIFRFLSSQYRFPRGFLGRYVGKKMDEKNDRQSDWVISLLSLQPKDNVLDVGFATGRVLKKIAKTVTTGKICGLDPSETMNKVATERLESEIKSGRVQLYNGYAEEPLFPPYMFTKIYAIHVVYFWEDLKTVFIQLNKILTHGGIVAIFYVSPIISSNKNFHEYSEDQIKSAILSAGFKNVRTEYKQFGKQHGICILAQKDS